MLSCRLRTVNDHITPVNDHITPVNDHVTTKKHTHKIVYSECLLRLGVLRVFVLFCVFVFCTGRFVMEPFNLTCLYCLHHSIFEHLDLYVHVTYM